MSHQTIHTSKIHTEGLQVRAETNRAHVDDLVELFGNECQWPALPECVVFHDGEHYFLADGHHRYQAASEAGCAEIPCEVRQGDKTAALWFAIGANAEHGLRRTNEDKRRAVLMAYQLDSSLSDRELARRARVGHSMASYVLADLRKSAPLSNLDSGSEQSVSLSESDSSGPQAESPATAQIAQCEGDVSGGGWIAPGETYESTRTPWDDAPDALAAAETPAASSSTRPASTPSTIPASTAGSSIGPTATPAIAAKTEPTPDIRTDARGRKLDVSRIGKARRSDRPAPSGPVDALGVPLTPATAPAFLTAMEIDGIVKMLREAQTRLAAIAGAPGAELLRQHALKCEKGGDEERYRSSDIGNAIKELQHWRPYSGTCPVCQGEPKPGCQVCLGLPYVIKAAFERCPEKLKAKVKAMVSPR
jgi:hypothetical protein